MVSVSPRMKQIPGNWPGSSILPKNGLSALSWALVLNWINFLVTDQAPPFSQGMDSVGLHHLWPYYGILRDDYVSQQNLEIES